jgi:hypothetical protein
VIRASLPEVDGTYPAVLLPDKMYRRQRFGKVEVAKVERTSPTSYSIGLSIVTTPTGGNAVPVVWLDLSNEAVKRQKVLFHFSDNAFAMLEQSTTIRLEIFENPQGVEIKKEHVVVKTL